MKRDARTMICALWVLASALATSGCLHYRAYQVETDGSATVLRRVDRETVAATGGEIEVRPVDHAPSRPVESLQGARVRVRASGGDVVLGDVVQAEGHMIAIQSGRSASAIDEQRSSVRAIDLTTVKELDVADARGEAAITAGVVVGVVGALLACVAAGFSGIGGN